MSYGPNTGNANGVGNLFAIMSMLVAYIAYLVGQCLWATGMAVVAYWKHKRSES